MTFATAIEGSKTRRFALVRAVTGRHVTLGLVVHSGSVYKYDFGFSVATSGLKRNGTAFTLVASLALVNSAGKFYVDETVGTVYLYPTGGTVTAATDHYVFSHYLFWTDREGGVAAPETPTDTSSIKRAWEPRLLDNPVVRQQVSDVFIGIFTIDSGSVSLANADRALYRYLGTNDSFSQKAIDIWFCVDTTSTIQHVYRGRCNAATVSTAALVLGFYDDFSRLAQPAYMGDTVAKARYKRETGSFPSLYPPDHLRAIPYVFGRSAYGLSLQTLPLATVFTVPPSDTGFGGGVSQPLDPDLCSRASCTSASSTIATSTNRTWGIARTSSVGFKTLSFGTILGATLRKTVADVGYLYTYNGTDRAAMIIFASGHNLEVGDSFRWTHASVNAGSAQYAVITHLAEATSFGVGLGYDAITCMVLSRSAVAADVTVTTATFTTNSGPGLVISGGGGVYYPAYTRDFTASTTTLASGNKYLSVAFVSGFESGNNYDGVAYHPNIGILEPGAYTVSFRATQADTSNSFRHDVVLQRIMEDAGLTCNAASFAAAGAALDVDCSFTIPNIDEEDLDSFLKYAQDILVSTQGYASLNSDSEVVYSLLSGPSAAVTSTDEAVYRDLAIDVDYQDIATEIVAHNPHRPAASIEAFSSVFDLNDMVASSDRARYLHEINNQIIFRHVLADATLVLPSIQALRAERKAFYRFSTASRYLAAGIGEDASLNSSELLGQASTADLKIIGITKTTSEVQVEATDLEGL